MDNQKKPLILIVTLVTVFLVVGIAIEGCQLFLGYDQWYFENRRSEPIRIDGPFDRVFVIPPCYAGYYQFLHHVAKTYDEATDIAIYIDNQGSTLVPSSTIIFNSLVNIGMVQVIITSESKDICNQAITDVFQVQLQNDTSNAIEVTYNKKLLGISDPGTLTTLGPIQGMVTILGFDFQNLGNDVSVGTEELIPIWKIGDIPTIKYKTYNFHF
jgi:hypothetical protein